jgi:hypothetical protein
MNWIERGDFDDIEKIHSSDRPRGLAAAVMLAEVVLCVWLSSSLELTPVAAGGGGHPDRLVALASLQMFPDAMPEAVPQADRQSVTADDATPPTPGPPSTLTEGRGDGDSLIGEPAEDDVRIVSASPSTTLRLWVGDIVNFEFTVEYNLASASSAPLRLTIEECSCDEPSPLLGVPKPSRSELLETHLDTTAERGRRTFTFSKRLRVPVSRLMAVSVHFVRDDATPGPFDRRFYQVQDGGRPPVGAQNYVKIVSILPNPDSPLRAGTEVLFDLVTEYNLVDDQGILQLSVGDPDLAPLARFSADVKRGQRPLRFRERVSIPDAAAESGKLNVTLQFGEGVAPQTVTYKVEGR